MSAKTASANGTRTRMAWGLWLLLLACAGCSRGSGELKRYRQVREFSLMERSGKPIARSELDGKIWIANFFFAGCSTECSSVLANMASLQDRLRTLTNVYLVSFTTDPRSDTPEALTRFAAQFEADPERWLFVTGDRRQLLQTIVHDFLLPVTKDHRAQADLLSGLVHSDQMALVDAGGTVRAYFNGLEARTPDRVLVAVHQLLQEMSSPPEVSEVSQ